MPLARNGVRARRGTSEPTDVQLHFQWEELTPVANRKDITPAELMLVLLETGPVVGKTMMQKQMFLAYEEVFNRRGVMDPEFRPDYFGPYSRLVADICPLLRARGRISIDSRGEGHSTYRLLEQGEPEVEKITRNVTVKKRLSGLRQAKASWDEFTTQGILRYVYRNYPEFTTKTKVPFLRWE